MSSFIRSYVFDINAIFHVLLQASKQMLLNNYEILNFEND